MNSKGGPFQQAAASRHVNVDRLHVGTIEQQPRSFSYRLIIMQSLICQEGLIIRWVKNDSYLSVVGYCRVGRLADLCAHASSVRLLKHDSWKLQTWKRVCPVRIRSTALHGTWNTYLVIHLWSLPADKFRTRKQVSLLRARPYIQAFLFVQF